MSASSEVVALHQQALAAACVRPAKRRMVWSMPSPRRVTWSTVSDSGWVNVVGAGLDQDVVAGLRLEQRGEDLILRVGAGIDLDVAARRR